MTTADSVLVPIQCEYYALEGLSQLIHTIDLVQQRLNPELHIDGIVFTMYDVRTNLSNQVVENVRTNLDTKIYDTLISVLQRHRHTDCLSICMIQSQQERKAIAC